MPSSRGSSQPGDQTQVSHIAGRFFTVLATREALKNEMWLLKGTENFKPILKRDFKPNTIELNVKETTKN